MNALSLSADQWPAWEQAAARCPWASFFCSRLWLEAQPPAWGDLRVIGLWQGDELAGGAAFHQRRLLGRHVWTTHPMVPYASFWVSQPQQASASHRESLMDDAAEALDGYVGGMTVEAFVKLEPRVHDVRPFLRRGWQANPYFTYETDVAPQLDLESAFENDARRQIAKARRTGIAVREDADWTGFAYRAQGTLERKGLSGPYSPGFLERLGAALKSERRGTLLSAVSSEGDPLASAVLVWQAGRATYLYGASDDRARGTGAPSLLQAEILAFLQRRGDITVYDWHGANSPEVARFKKNFNPRLVSGFTVRKCRSLALGAAHALRDAWRRWAAGRAQRG